jgi:hypothetical protein
MMLRKIIGVGLCLSILCVSVWLHAAPTMQELFLRANNAYQQGQVQQALDTYQSISPKGSVVWYNMGLCFARQGNAARALACWRRAEHTASFAELRLITQAIGTITHVRSAERAWGFIVAARDAVRCYALVLPPVLIQLLFLLGLCLLFFCSKWWYYGLHGKSVLLGAFCITCAGAGSMYLQFQEQHRQRGVVVVAHAPVYSGPDCQFHEQGVLTSATEVVLQQTQGSWYKVAHDDLTGWVAADAIVVV